MLLKRLLVGLRWHNEILDDNTEKWIFESYDEKVQLNLFDKTLFWWTQGGMVIFWLVMTIIQLIGFDFFWVILQNINRSNDFFLRQLVQLFAQYLIFQTILDFINAVKVI